MLPFLCAYAGTLLAWHWHGDTAWASSKRNLPKAERWGLYGALVGWLVMTAT
jgi:hypothetical protein